MTQPTLPRLQHWYLSLCNDSWEHIYGIKIENIDNPGWSLAVDLTDTYLEKVAYIPIQVQRPEEDDWLNCKVEDQKFIGFCGPLNFEEMLTTFLDWAETADRTN